MRRILLGFFAVAFFASFAPAQNEKKPLAAAGWGSLSGKVTLDGPIPEVVNLVPKMMLHADKACCLAKDAKPSEKIDQAWVVDPKTRAVANVMVWIAAPKGTYFPTPDKLKVRKEEVVIDQPHCAFIPRVSAYQPIYYDNGKKVRTGQTLIMRNSATVPHNMRVTGHPLINPGFNKNMPPKTEFKVDFNPQELPITLNCDVHTWMMAKLFVFDHPYYAKTKEDGTFAIPMVPAGAEVTVMAYHEGVGWAILKRDGDKVIKGKKMTMKEGKNTFDITISAPK